MIPFEDAKDPSEKDPYVTTKRVRMTLACERCRLKKVKCDFTHPACGRCEQTKVTCSYTGSSTQIDLYNLVKLNDTISLLQNRIESMDNDMRQIRKDTRWMAEALRQQLPSKDPPMNATTHASDSNSSSDDENNGLKEHSHQNSHTGDDTQTACLLDDPKSTAAARSLHAQDMFLPGLKSDWALSLTSTGLRIDTNILSLHDLYTILLSGMSQLQKKKEKSISASASPSSSSTTDADSPSMPLADKAIAIKHNPLYRSKNTTFPLYSAWESCHSQLSQSPSMKQWQAVQNTDTDPAGKPSANSHAVYPFPFPDSLEHQQLLEHYAQCFLCLPLVDQDQFMQKCLEKITSPLLHYAILSWAARHAAIYHGMFSGQDPNTVGEPYFQAAKSLLIDQFMHASIDMVHALLLMYIYSIGKTGPDRAKAESEAYILLGLAIRMCVDLRLHKEETNEGAETPPCPILCEKRRRLFAAAEFMEILCSAHSDKPMMFPSDDTVTIEPPRLMDHEVGERRYRVEFTVHRHKINQIYRNIHASISVKNPLLSSISALEKRLKDWYNELPPYFHFCKGDGQRRDWRTTSFREQACLKLNFEYHFQMCQLYSIFLPHPDEKKSAISLLSMRLCIEGADAITDLLECWAQLRQSWCHFTLDTLVMACIVYSNQLRSQNTDVQMTAKQQMQRIAVVLRSSPVQHHKYVRMLIHRIDRQIQGLSSSGTESFTAADEHQPEMQEPRYEDAPPPPYVLPSPPQPIELSPTHSVTMEEFPASLLQPGSVPSSNITAEWPWLNHPIPPSPNTAFIYSGFDGPFADLSVHDLFRFADFIYTPIMDVNSIIDEPVSSTVSHRTGSTSLEPWP
ncbi:uncharacterized protein BYT42DRAFT_286381 [Radiomyces spectabilis]|uniref:uncharacterized protein n=1 Tax=Radiomyces spectabilis TaxID=64574 RepID=UPI0022211C77|nr:uncharacterized protein BYT42DRAFT_286381 [Radiomyces spectabilis]KAI8380930.1 hypothetical protein BYT42DRAFT_286381 [Radiomyces spectabilis]